MILYLSFCFSIFVFCEYLSSEGVVDVCCSFYSGWEACISGVGVVLN